jgi:hypothetical protein
MLNFDYFNNSFALNKARDGCTRQQLKGIDDNWLPDLEELTFCVCCDDYNPNVLLACPNNPWSNPGKFHGVWKFIVLFLEPTCTSEVTTTNSPSTPGNILILLCRN